MLSVMDTPLGLTVINPAAQGSFRIAKEHPAYWEVKAIVKSCQPVQQTWGQINRLMTDPLESFRNWLRGFNIFFEEPRGKTDVLKLGNHSIDGDFWLAWLENLRICGGDPRHLLRFLNNLAAVLPQSEMQVYRLTAPLHVHDALQPANLLGVKCLPKEARYGDKISLSPSDGDCQFIVSYNNFSEIPSQDDGFVLCRLTKEMSHWQADILSQPMLLGLNRTYLCEEASPEGWLETLSTDSLAQAKQVVEEVRATGYEARIVNRLTNDVIW